MSNGFSSNYVSHDTLSEVVIKRGRIDIGEVISIMVVAVNTVMFSFQPFSMLSSTDGTISLR